MNPISYINNPDKDSASFKALEQFIVKMNNIYAVQAYKYKIGHHLTRRLESVAVIMVIFGLMVNLLTAVKQQSFEFSLAPLHLFDFVLIFIGLIFVLLNLGFDGIHSKHSLSQAKDIATHRIKANDHALMLLIAWLLLSVGFLPWIVVASHGAMWGVLVFVGAYSSNRKYGYTRAYMRNAYFQLRVEILKDQLDHDMDSIEVIRQQLQQICIEAKEQSYKDTVGDYIEVNNSALKWLSSKKLK